MQTHQCKMCYEEFEGDEPPNDYCPECRERFEDRYFMQLYEFRVAKLRLNKALAELFDELFKDTFIDRLIK